MSDQFLELLGIESGMTRAKLECGFHAKDDPALSPVYFPFMPASQHPAIVIRAWREGIIRPAWFARSHGRTPALEAWL